MIKKILFSILLFLSTFSIFTLNIKATFEDISPSITMVETSTQISYDIDFTINNTSPSLSYGTSTYNYIFNQFIPNELYLAYGEYYICGGNGTAYTSSCYISDSPDAFGLKYFYDGSSASPSMTYFYVYANPTDDHKVYKYTISSGSKSSNSAYITTSTQIASLYGDFNKGIYAPTNLPYFKMDDTRYGTIKTADGFMFNNGDVVAYDTGNGYAVNIDYKPSSSFEPLSLEITLEDYELMGDYYSSLTYKLTFSTFDTQKYRYYYTFDANNIDSQITRLLANQITSNDTLLTFEMNTTFYVIAKDNFNNTVLLISYEVNDIMNSRYDESLDVLDKHPDLPDKIDETTDITDDFSVANIVGWFRSLIDKRLPILSQISGVYNAFKFDLSVDSDCIEEDYDYTEEKGYIWRSYCNKIPELNLNGVLGINKSFEIIDVRFFWQYRETVFFWTKLTLGTYTFIKLLKIVASYFKH